MTTAVSFENDIKSVLDILNRKIIFQGEKKVLKIVAREFKPYGFNYLRFEEVLIYLSQMRFFKLKDTYSDHMIQIGAWDQGDIANGTYDLGIEHENQSYVILELSEDFKQKSKNYLAGKKLIEENGQPISSLEIVEPDKSLRYIVVINNQYDKPTSVRGKSWTFLQKVTNGNGVPITKLNKSYKDYFNSNERCKLYTIGNYRKTKIISERDGMFVAAIPIKIISNKSYQTKLNKLKAT